MSSKTRTTAPKEDATPALVPKLRFPEFREAKAWEKKKLGSEGELLSSLTGKAGADFDAGEARFVTYMNVFSNTFVDPKVLRFVDVKVGESQNAVASGDIFFTISSETPDEVGMSSVLLEELENCYLNSFCTLFRFSESKRPNPVFIGYLLRQSLIREYFTKKAQGSTRFNLSKDAFRSLPLCIPSLAEQQKVADCLSSVDELIAAQARKVDALKTRKKGLMQQLFPREGETQPRLRFSEFQNAREWRGDTLGAVCELYQPVTLSSSELSMTGEHLVYGANGVIGTHNEYNHEDSEVAVTCRGATCGEVTITKPKSWITGNAMVVKPRTGKLSRDFIFQYFKNHGLKTVISGSAQPQITRTGFAPFAIFLPEPIEQQHIASCLSSLDALITAETQELEALKTHKKGLMQRLFPSPKEVEA